MNADSVESHGRGPREVSSVARVLGATAWGCAIVAFQALLWFMWLFILLKCEPLLERILYERDVPLPAMTQNFVMLAHGVASYWYLLALPAAVLAPLEVAVIASSAVWRKRWLLVLRYLLIALLSLVPLLLLAWAVVALGLTIQVATDDMMRMLGEIA